MSKPFLYILLLFMAMCQVVDAQYNAYQGRKKMPRLFEGMHLYAKLGPNNWFGDLVDKGKVRVGISVGADRPVFNWMDAGVELDGGMLHGYMKRGADLEFKTFFFDINSGIKISFLDLIQGYYADRIIIPYAGFGGGGMLYSAEKKTKKIGIDFDDPVNDWWNVKTGLTFAPLIYGNIGVTYVLTPDWKLFGEIKGIYIMDDEVDGHSGYRKPNGEWWESHGNDCMWNMMVGAKYRLSHSNFYTTNKYNRRNYVKNKRVFKRNAQNRQQRR